MMESARPETVTAGEHISSDVSNNHLTYESGSLGRSSQGSLSAGAETVASENEHQHTASLDNVEVRDEKEIVDNATVVEVDKLHEEAVKSATSLGSKGKICISAVALVSSLSLMLSLSLSSSQSSSPHHRNHHHHQSSAL